MSTLLREPIVHLMVAGLVLFVAGEVHRQRVDTYRVVISPQREAHLGRRYALQFGAAPDTATLEELVQRDIEEEILFRRGLALGLDRDDEIVRRRIVQKTRFLLQDLQAPAEPSDAELESYFAAHPRRYGQDARVTFTHVYFSVHVGEEVARARARQALDVLARRAEQPGDLGDAFHDSYHFSAYEREQLHRLFGRSEFADAAFTAPLERWTGPYRSAYGVHLIRVEARAEAQPATFAAVRDKVRADYLLDAQTRANARTFDELARDFTVVRESS
jgi:hypothetical protein